MKSIFIKPKLTEKTLEMTRQGVYTFITPKGANKIEIKKIIAQRFKVKIKSVNVINRQGKTKRFAKKIGKRTDLKIAIVTLEKGEKIKEFDVLFETDQKEKAKLEASKNAKKTKNIEDKSQTKVTVRKAGLPKEEK